MPLAPHQDAETFTEREFRFTPPSASRIPVVAFATTVMSSVRVNDTVR